MPLTEVGVTEHRNTLLLDTLGKAGQYLEQNEPMQCECSLISITSTAESYPFHKEYWRVRVSLFLLSEVLNPNPNHTLPSNVKTTSLYLVNNTLYIFQIQWFIELVIFFVPKSSPFYLISEGHLQISIKYPSEHCESQISIKLNYLEWQVTQAIEQYYLVNI